MDASLNAALAGVQTQRRDALGGVDAGQAVHFHKLGESAKATLLVTPDGYAEPEELPRRCNYLSISNTYGLAAIFSTNADEESVVDLYTLETLRVSLRQATKKNVKVSKEKVRATLAVERFAGNDASVSFVRFANGDRDLIVTTLDGRIFVFALRDVLTNPSAQPRHVFPSALQSSGATLAVLPNPSAQDGLQSDIAIVTEKGDIRLIDLAKLQEAPPQGSLQGLGATAACWSPAGKQLAVGTRDGKVVALTPDGTVKTVFGPLPDQPGLSVMNVVYLGANEIVVTYHDPQSLAAPLTSAVVRTTATSTHSYHLLLSTETDLDVLPQDQMSLLSLPGFGGFKQLICACHSGASEIQWLASDPSNNWEVLALGEDSKPLVPARADLDPNYVVSAELDLTSSDPVVNPFSDGEDAGGGKLPPGPILWVLAQDGQLCGWDVLQPNAGQEKYAKMVTPKDPLSDAPQQPAAPAAAFGAPSGTTGFGASQSAAPNPFGASTGTANAFGGPPAQANPFAVSSSSTAGGFGSGLAGFGTQPFGGRTAALAQQGSGASGGGFASFANQSGGFGGFASSSGGTSIFDTPSPAEPKPAAPSGGGFGSFATPSTGSSGGGFAAFAKPAGGPSGFASFAGTTSGLTGFGAAASAGTNVFGGPSPAFRPPAGGGSFGSARGGGADDIDDVDVPPASQTASLPEALMQDDIDDDGMAMTPPASSASNTVPSVPMSTATTPRSAGPSLGGFGGLGLGATAAASPQPPKSSVFGSSASTSSPWGPTSPAGGAFGASSAPPTSTAFAPPPSTGVFGSSSGAPASSFGASPAPASGGFTASTAAPTTGAFGAFKATPNAFGGNVFGGGAFGAAKSSPFNSSSTPSAFGFGAQTQSNLTAFGFGTKPTASTEQPSQSPQPSPSKPPIEVTTPPKREDEDLPKEHWANVTPEQRAEAERIAATTLPDDDGSDDGLAESEPELEAEPETVSDSDDPGESPSPTPTPGPAKSPSPPMPPKSELAPPLPPVAPSLSDSVKASLNAQKEQAKATPLPSTPSSAPTRQADSASPAASSPFAMSAQPTSDRKLPFSFGSKPVEPPAKPEARAAEAAVPAFGAPFAFSSGGSSLLSRMGPPTKQEEQPKEDTTPSKVESGHARPADPPTASEAFAMPAASASASSPSAVPPSKTSTPVSASRQAFGGGGFSGFKSATPRTSSPLAQSAFGSSKPPPAPAPVVPKATMPPWPAAPVAPIPTEAVHQPLPATQSTASPTAASFGRKQSSASPFGLQGQPHPAPPKPVASPSFTTSPSTAEATAGPLTASKVPKIQVHAGSAPSLGDVDKEAIMLRLCEDVDADLQALKDVAKSCADYASHVAAQVHPKEREKVPANGKQIDLLSLGGLLLDLARSASKLLEDAKAGLIKTSGFEGSLLKADSKRDEATRYVRAFEDPGFARLVRSRELGPEQLASQAKIRRTCDRIRTLLADAEELLALTKRRLADAKGGRGHISAGPIDTINRTVRNISHRLMQQNVAIDQLASRFESVELDADENEDGFVEVTHADATVDDLADISTASKLTAHERSFHPTIGTAARAALQDEVSASILKTALLRARSEPLLTRPEKAGVRSDQTSRSLADISERGPLTIGQLPSAAPPRRSPVNFFGSRSPTLQDSMASHASFEATTPARTPQVASPGPSTADPFSGFASQKTSTSPVTSSLFAPPVDHTDQDGGRRVSSKGRRGGGARAPYARAKGEGPAPPPMDARGSAFVASFDWGFTPSPRPSTTFAGLEPAKPSGRSAEVEPDEEEDGPSAEDEHDDEDELEEEEEEELVDGDYDEYDEEVDEGDDPEQSEINQQRDDELNSFLSGGLQG